MLKEFDNKRIKLIEAIIELNKCIEKNYEKKEDLRDKNKQLEIKITKLKRVNNNE